MTMHHMYAVPQVVKDRVRQSPGTGVVDSCELHVGIGDGYKVLVISDSVLNN